MSGNHGKFVWYEMMTNDLAASQKFYGDVIGWTAKDAGMPGMTYMLFKTGDRDVAGLMELTKDMCDSGARPGWMGHVCVDNVDASAAKAKAAGAAVHVPPTDIPNVGRFAVISDPQGAVISLFQPKDGDAPAAPAMGTPGFAGWHELFANDLEPAFKFYADMFGWTKDTAMDMGEMGVYQIFALNGVGIGGMMRKTPDIPAPFWNYYFNVESIDAAIERVKAAGGQVVMGPQEVPGGSWIIQGIDPQGAVFALVAARR